MRTLAALTGYFYAVRADDLYVNVYAQSEGEVKLAGTTVKLTQATNYPWRGDVRLTVSPAVPAKFTLRVRIPEWAQGRPVPTDLYAYDSAGAPPWKVRVAGETVMAAPENGYVAINREWRAGDMVELYFPMRAQAVQRKSRGRAGTRGVRTRSGGLLF
jgi:DUF1680 family protein